MSAEPRVLVTGVGGPSGISILRAMEREPVTLFAGDIDPYAAGLYLVGAEQRALLLRGDDPRFAAELLARCRSEAIDVVVPTVDSELLPLARRRADFAAAGVTLVLASEETLLTCLDKWALAERCRGGVRIPATTVADAAFDPAAIALPVIVKPRSGSGSRGIRLVDRRAELEALERDGTLLVQEHLPGPEYSLDVLARADGRVAAVVPRERLKVDSGIAVTGRTLHDEGLERFARDVAALIGLTTVANVQVKVDAAGEPALLEVNARFPGTMPLTIAAGVDMPRLAIGEALGTPIADGPLPFEDIAMVRFFQERFFAFDDISDLQRHAAEVASLNPLADLHVHSTFSDGRDRLEDNVAEAEALGLTALGCVDHVRADTDWVGDYVEAVQRLRAETAVELRCGIEAKLLDTTGALDLPEGIDGVDAIYAADHQVPLAEGPTHPRAVRERIAAGELDAQAVIDAILTSTARALDRPQRVVIAHFLSILPKVGLTEADVPPSGLERLAAATARSGQEIEISERWRCPSAATLRPFLRHGVPIVLSTDSHKRDTIGRYEHCLAVRRELQAG